MKKSTLGILIALVALVLVVGVVVANRSKDTETTTPATDTHAGHETSHEMTEEPATTNEEEPSATNEVEIKDFAFSPATVTIKKGSTVTWTNQDSTAHTVTSDEGSTMDSELLEQGETYSVTFNEVGTFKYHCKPHPQMTGTVVVTD